MIGEWLASVPALLVTVALLVLPGYAAARAARLHGLTAWAAAPPASLTVIGLASVVAPMLGMPWSILPVLLVAVAIIAIAGISGYLGRTHGVESREKPLRWRTALTGGLLVGGILIAVQMVLVAGAPENFSQTFDNVFHLNAARFVLDTQNASPLHVGQMTSPSGNVPFYPADGTQSSPSSFSWSDARYPWRPMS